MRVPNNSVLCQTSPHFTVLDKTAGSKNLENSLTGIEKHPRRENSMVISQNAEGEEEEVIETSQDLVEDHIFEEPAKKHQKKTVQETCTFDSNEIIPASYMTPTQKSRRHIKDTSSLSMSPASGAYGTLASLNESDYEEQHMLPVKETKRKKVARKLSEVDKDNSENGGTATEPKKQKTVIAESEQEREMQWTYSSQDAVVLAAVNERRANAQMDADPVTLSNPKSKVDERPGNEKKRANLLSPFLEDSDSVGVAVTLKLKVMERTDVLTKSFYPTKLASQSLHKKTDDMEMAEKLICEVIIAKALQVNRCAYFFCYCLGI
jgi:hypothetical protein